MDYRPEICINNNDYSCCFAVRAEVIKQLIVIAINPSTTNNKPDRTINRVY